MASVSRQPYGRAEKNTPEYQAWVEMRRRCRERKNYADRGIKVCERWYYYPNFLEDMGRRPGPEYSVERENNDGDYEPPNCVWATVKAQGNNRRTNHLLTAFGRTKTIQQWCDEYDVPDTTFHNRLKRGWSVEKAITTPRMIQYDGSRGRGRKLPGI